MVDAASSPKLKKASCSIWNKPGNTWERLDQIFQNRQVTGSRKKCKGIEGILEEKAANY